MGRNIAKARYCAVWAHSSRVGGWNTAKGLAKVEFRSVTYCNGIVASRNVRARSCLAKAGFSSAGLWQSKAV